jgi:CheY-like chemotaxis protein
MDQELDAVAEDISPDRFSDSDSACVVGVTPEGSIPLIVEDPPGGSAIVRLPGLSGRCLQDADAVRERLRREIGFEARELIVMSRYGIPTGERGQATMLLAPELAKTSPAAPGVALVPLSELVSWLNARKSAGARIDPKVWVGLILAERHFPRWARARLGAGLGKVREGGRLVRIPARAPSAVKRILLADDDPGIRDGLARLLSRQYEVITARDGEGVLAEIARQPIDLVLLDMFMPLVDGEKALESMRARGSTTPVILMSAQSRRLDRTRALGADDCLAKPFAFHALEEKIERLLGPGGPPSGRRSFGG